MSSDLITHALTSTSTNARPAVDLKRVVSNACSKGYEAGAVDLLQKRAISQTMSTRADIPSMSDADLYKEIGSNFMKIVDQKGGFLTAYKAEIEFIKTMGAIMAESRTEDLAQEVARFSASVSSGVSPTYEAKMKVVNEARMTASVLRIIGQDDEHVVRLISQNDQLTKHGIAKMTAEVIDADKAAIAQSRAAASAKSVKKKLVFMSA